jgi:DNA mismatch endonuclease, patch repair protein
MDNLSPQQRSALMSRIRGKNTAPEIAVRRTLHALGFRFRLHRRDLPGCPDVVLAKHRTIVFVQGCFWHGHDGCRRSALPKTNRGYWRRKILRNRARDVLALRALKAKGWRVRYVWECQTRDPAALLRRLSSFFRQARRKDGLNRRSGKY